MAAAKSVTVLEKLRKPFPATQVKKNQDGLDYVSIDGYIGRLLEVLGMEYDFTVTQSSVELLPDAAKTKTGKLQYLAQITAQLRIGETTRAGVGADISFDPDKAVKTAQAEALKKAAHQYGVALELWDEEHRASLKLARNAASGSEAALKKSVFDLAKKRLNKTKPTVAEVAELFGVETGELSDKGTLARILEEQGVI